MCAQGAGRPRTPGAARPVPSSRASRSAGHTSAEPGPSGIPGSRDRQARLTANFCLPAPILGFSGTLRSPVFNPKGRSQSFLYSHCLRYSQKVAKTETLTEFNPQKFEFTQTYLQTLQSSPANFPSRKRPWIETSASPV